MTLGNPLLLSTINEKPDKESTSKSDVAGVEQSAGFKSWENIDAQEEYTEELEHRVMSSWGMMFCGGSAPIIAALQDVLIS